MSSNPGQTALRAKVSEPQSKDDPTDVKFVEIELPPPEMWSELDNSGGAAKPVKTEEKVGVPAERPIAALSFLKSMTHTIPLDFPFNHPVQGPVEVVTVRRLTVGQMGDILDRRDRNAPDMFDIYAVMTGLEADVIRGLEATDGERVTGVCFDFLPPLLRPVRTD